MTEEQILKGRLTDLANQAYHQNTYTYSNFLSASELCVLEVIKKELSFIHCETFGGSPLCERRIVQFGSEHEFGYEGRFPISIIKATPRIAKFSDDFNHRDVLGALMNLGIERNTIGDIIIKDKSVYIFCLEKIAGFICEELTKVKHTNICCEITNADTHELCITFIDEEFPVPSLRLDGILSSLLKCSRKQALTLFSEKKVILNGTTTERNSIQLKEGDIFSVRGHGKFLFAGTGGSTKKGKIYVHVKRYQ